MRLNYWVLPGFKATLLPEDLPVQYDLELATECIKAVCAYTKVPYERVTSKSRLGTVVQVRMISMKLIKTYFRFSLKEIGSLFPNGGKPRDHTTVIHNLSTFNDMYKTDEGFRKLFRDIEIEITRKIFQSSKPKTHAGT